jgi:hypothetical protein
MPRIESYDSGFVSSTATFLHKHMPRKNQTPPCPNAERASAIKKYDRAISVLADIRTLAELLEAIGTRTDAEPVDVTLVSMTGNMIARCTDDLRKVLGSILQTGQK